MQPRNLWRYLQSVRAIGLSNDEDELQAGLGYQSVPPKRSYVVRVVCVEIREGEPGRYCLDDLNA
jgi:hypothetical protein